MKKTNIGSCIMKAFVWIVGLVSLVYGGIALFTDTSDFTAVQAVVVSTAHGTTDDWGTESYNVTITYLVNGVQYTDTISDKTEYVPGDQLTQYVDPDDPGHTFNSPGEPASLGLIGVVFGLFCLGSMGWGALKARRAKKNLPVAGV